MILRPGQARVLVGHRHRRNVVMSATDQLTEPTACLIGPCPGKLHHRLAAVDQQRTKVDVAAFADAQQLGLAATGVLMRHKSYPRRELPRVLEVGRIAGASYKRAGGHGADSGNGLYSWKSNCCGGRISDSTDA